MRRRRARQVRKQIAVIGGIAIFLVLTVVIVSINLYKGSKEKKQRALVKAAVEECYAAFSASKEEEVPVAKIEKEQADFAEWFVKHYTDQTEGALLKKAEKGELTQKDIYEATGETLQVLTDRKKGWLDDEQTAKEHQIYIREGREKKQAEVTIAGDICFAEEGFVLDHYDETDGLEECIS